MTVLLVVACLAVAGAELYLAFGRSKRDTAALTDLRASHADLAARLEDTAAVLASLRDDLAERPEAGDLARLARKVDAAAAELGTRLDGARRTQDELGSRFDTTADDLRRTQDALAGRLDATAFDLRHVEDDLTARLEALSARSETLAERTAQLADRTEHLSNRTDELTGRADSVADRVEAATQRLEDAAAAPDRLDALLPELTTRMDSHDGILDELSQRVDEIGEIPGVERLRDDLVALRLQIDLALERLEELDTERDRDLERYRDLAQALDSVEDLLAGQRTADAEPAAVRGGLVGDTPDRHEVLTKAYEDFVDAMDLRVRMQVPAGSAPWHTQYFLAGKNPARLRRDFGSLLTALRSPQPDPRREALHRLAGALLDSDESYAQIGPLVLLRVPDALLCGVLTVAENRRFDTDRFLSDPGAAAARLRLLPDGRFRDLSSWPTAS